MVFGHREELSLLFSLHFTVNKCDQVHTWLHKQNIRFQVKTDSEATEVERKH